MPPETRQSVFAGVVVPSLHSLRSSTRPTQSTSTTTNNQPKPSQSTRAATLKSANNLQQPYPTPQSPVRAQVSDQESSSDEEETAAEVAAFLSPNKPTHHTRGPHEQGEDDGEGQGEGQLAGWEKAQETDDDQHASAPAPSRSPRAKKTYARKKTTRGREKAPRPEPEPQEEEHSEEQDQDEEEAQGEDQERTATADEMDEEDQLEASDARDEAGDGNSQDVAGDAYQPPEEDQDEDDDESAAPPAGQTEKGKQKNKKHPSASAAAQKSPRKQPRTSTRRSQPSQSRSRPSPDAEADAEGNGLFSGLRGGSIEPLSSDDDDRFIPAEGKIDEQFPPKLFMRPCLRRDGWVPERIWLHNVDWEEGERKKWAGFVRKEGGFLVKKPRFGVTAVLPGLDRPEYPEAYRVAAAAGATLKARYWLECLYSVSRREGRRRFSVEEEVNFRAHPPPKPPPAFLTKQELAEFGQVWMRWKNVQDRWVSKERMFELMQEKFFDGTSRTLASGYSRLFEALEEQIEQEAQRIRRAEEEEEEAWRRDRAREREEEEEDQEESGLELEEERPRKRKKTRAGDQPANKKNKGKGRLLFPSSSDEELDDDLPEPYATQSHSTHGSRSTSARVAGSSQSKRKRRTPPASTSLFRTDEDEAFSSQDAAAFDSNFDSTLSHLAARYSFPLPLVKQMSAACSHSLTSTRRLVELLDSFFVLIDKRHEKSARGLMKRMQEMTWTEEEDQELLNGRGENGEADGEGDGEGKGDLENKSEGECEGRRRFLAERSPEDVQEERWWPSLKVLNRLHMEHKERLRRK
ncbi:hypothetical protein JCM11641_003778 [Rhodosporidiobolus odoratus]